MKKMKLFLLLTLVLPLVISSCKEIVSKEFISESNDKQAMVKVYGKKATAVEPFTTSIVIKGYNQSDTLMTQIYTSEFDENSVSTVWKDNNNCRLTFTQQDGAKKILDINFSADGNSLHEVK